MARGRGQGTPDSEGGGGVVREGCEFACVKTFRAYLIVCTDPWGEAGRLCGVELDR
jgi:hypothetical protein